MDSKRYFLDVVRPAYRRYESGLHDASLQFGIIVLLYHMVDYIAAEQGLRSTGAAVKSTVSSCSDFEIIQAVANAQKHVVYSGARTNPHRGLSSDDIGAETVTSNGELVTLNGESVTVGPPYVRLPDGTHRELFPIVRTTFLHFQRLYGQY